MRKQFACVLTMRKKKKKKKINQQLWPPNPHDPDKRNKKVTQERKKRNPHLEE